MGYEVYRLADRKIFKEFLIELKKVDKFNKFQSYYRDISEFLEDCDSLNTSREIYRFEDITDNEIYNREQGDTSIEAYYRIEIDYCTHVIVHGYECLEQYDVESEIYNISSFGFINSVEIA